MAAMRGAKRVWRDNSEFAGKADAEQVQQEINMLAKQDPNGKCRNEALVDFARRHPASESYKCFEWDDAKAADSYRLQQAARIKCSIITVTQTVPHSLPNVQKPIKVVTNHALPTPGDGHKDIQLILKDANDTSALQQEMYNNLRTYVANFEKRFAFAPTSTGIIQQLQAIVAMLP